MSTKTTLADEMASILCERNEKLEERYTEVVDAVSDALDEDWDKVFAPWLDSIQERTEQRLGLGGQ